jgi:asparagine synthase (glutamine-hydrolysing)
MCGIAGAVAFTEEGRKYLDRIEDAVAALRHRGPDGEGVFRKDNVVLGHTRLAVIDTSANAAQPFTSTDDRFTIVFNGEIFNYKELRERLIHEGAIFRTQSDTEVLLELYARGGFDSFAELNGFFALAIYNHETGFVTLARDRYGEKPLYWYYDEHVTIFASELNALKAFGVKDAIDEEALRAYLHLNYIPGNNTIYQNICNHPVGFCNRIHKDYPFIEDDFYSIRDISTDATISYEDATLRVRQLTEEAVQRRLVSDVPLGTFLSGGLDSSIVTAIAAKHKKGIESFSIGFADEPYFDETEYARLVSKHLGTKHHVFSLTNNDLLESLYSFLENCDEPFADSSALAVNILAKETRKHVTVALSGDGADELFAGYNKHEAELRIRSKSLLRSVAKSGSSLWNILPASRNSLVGNRVRQLRKFAEGATMTIAERYWRWAGFTSEEDLNKLIPQLSQATKIKKFHLAEFSHSDNFNQILSADMQMVLRGDMLVKVDRMSMRHALEVRPPFLDYQLVDYVMQLPANYKIEAGNRKKILKDAFRNDLPAEIFTRRKQGFEVPLVKWFRAELTSMLDEYLGEKFIKEQNLFNATAINDIRRQLHSSNPGDSATRIWGLLVFQYWWKKQKS